MARKPEKRVTQENQEAHKSGLLWVERAYRDAFRRPRAMLAHGKYSRMVMYLKMILPATALALLILLVIWPSVSGSDKRFHIKAVSMDSFNAKELKMVNPKFVGTDNRNRPFTITATSARQRNGFNQSVILEDMSADLTTEQNTWMSLMAKEGTFNRGGNELHLKGGVSLFHDQGYEFVTEEARINLKTSEIKGTKPVKGHGPSGEIEAEGFEIESGGERLYLLGKTKLILYL